MTDEHRAIPDPHWEVQPLRSIEGEVPLPFTVVGATEQTVSVTLNVGQTVLVAADGTVSNEYGSPLFRLVRASLGVSER